MPNNCVVTYMSIINCYYKFLLSVDYMDTVL